MQVRELASKRGVCLAFIAIDSPAALVGAPGASTSSAGAAGAGAPAAAAPAGGGSLLDMQVRAAAWGLSYCLQLNDRHDHSIDPRTP